MNLYLIRHAEIDLKYRGKYVGALDIPISHEGRVQAQALSHQISLFNENPVTWSSPLMRCTGTLELMAPHLKYEIIEDLREINFGMWEGKTFSEIARSSPELIRKWAEYSLNFAFPKGDSLLEFLNRMKKVKTMILSSRVKNLVLVTHGGVISTLLCLFLDLDPSNYLLFHLDRPSLSSIEIFQNGKGILRSLNQFGNISLSKKIQEGEWPG